GRERRARSPCGGRNSRAPTWPLVTSRSPPLRSVRSVRTMTPMRYALASLVLLAACTSSGPYCELTQATAGPVVRLHGFDCFSEPYTGADGVPRGTWAA